SSATGCVSDATLDTGDSTESIIGGFPLRSHRFDGVVMMFEADETGDFGRLCSGTLVTPTMVVTAKHCVTDPPLVVERTVIRIGFDGLDHTDRTIKVRGVAVES